MTFAVLIFFGLLVVSTSFLAGVFGMAGGMILMGGLLLILPVPQAMILHGLTQATANGARAFFWSSHIGWRIVARYCAGLVVAAACFLAFTIVPDERVVLVTIGLLPLIGLALPKSLSLQADRPGQAEICGFVCTALQFVSGVSGPTLDLFFVRSAMDRRSVVATKAACQVVTHLAKTLYFGVLLFEFGGSGLGPAVIIASVLLAILGTMLSRRVLEAMTDQSFRKYTGWIVGMISAAYLAWGVAAFF